jgi:hypothetical protein
VEEAVMEVTEPPYITVEQQQAFDREMDQSLVQQDGEKGGSKAFAWSKLAGQLIQLCKKLVRTAQPHPPNASASQKID